MKNIFKRLGVAFLICIMCISSFSVVSFAAEVENVDTAQIEPQALGDLRTITKIEDLRENNRCTIKLNSANWDANFVVTVVDNPYANYYVTLVRPNNESETRIVGGGGGSTTFNLTYASAGTYTIIVTKNQGTENYAHAVVQLFD